VLYGLRRDGDAFQLVEGAAEVNRLLSPQAKAGVVGFTRAFAQEAAPHGVLVNSIAPGPIDTRLNDTLSDEWKAWKASSLPLRRIGRPEEIAPSAVLLASADGDFYVGQTLHPNGGDVMP
jgi:3-oxoacyl-[acyl-carrier protein] reductase